MGCSQGAEQARGLGDIGHNLFNIPLELHNLFSSDLELTAKKMIKDYRLRFQIEFTFRDAKQHWGLEYFMNVKEQTIHNAANIAMFMVNVALAIGRLQRPPFHLASMT